MQESDYKVSKNIYFHPTFNILTSTFKKYIAVDYVEGTSPGAVQDSKEIYDILLPPKGLTNWRGEKERSQALKIVNIKLTMVRVTRKLKLSFVGTKRRDICI